MDFVFPSFRCNRLGLAKMNTFITVLVCDLFFSVLNLQVLANVEPMNGTRLCYTLPSCKYSSNVTVVLVCNTTCRPLPELPFQPPEPPTRGPSTLSSRADGSEAMTEGPSTMSYPIEITDQSTTPAEGSKAVPKDSAVTPMIIGTVLSAILIIVILTLVIIYKKYSIKCMCRRNARVDTHIQLRQKHY
ncbi:uncharacterized protein [Ptychodera flava]|uniref:uncharacterized protein n=1 Tax=Ptychodera flava TaxID=63121 RepID=UPI00396A4D70